MSRRLLCAALFVLPFLALPALSDENGPPPLAIGAAAPEFCLPGIDGQTHCLKEYNASKVLVIAFTCNHCPTAQLYESRIKQLAADYHDRGVALVAIEPNNPNAVRLDEMGYTDVGDSFEDMKTRAAYRHFNFPYLYDGETQKTSRAYGPSATPHLFIFDSERKLRYEGRVDNNPREPLVTVRDARKAIDALLANKPVPVAKTPSVGCSTKWMYKEEGRKEELAEIEGQPVKVQPANSEDLKALRKNQTGKLVLVNFWATWCGPCQQEMPLLDQMYKKYKPAGFTLIGVNVDKEGPAVKDLMARKPVSFPVLLDPANQVSKAYHVDEMPSSVIIDRKGEIRYIHRGYRPGDENEYQDRIRQLIRE